MTQRVSLQIDFVKWFLLFFFLNNPFHGDLCIGHDYFDPVGVKFGTQVNKNIDFHLYLSLI